MKRAQMLTASIVLGSLMATASPRAGDGWMTQAKEPIVVRVDWTGRAVRRSIDFRPGVDLLAVLERLRKERGKDYPVMVILDERVPLSEVSNAAGLLGKAGLENIRLFSLAHDTQRMVELTRGTSMLPPPRPK